MTIALATIADFHPAVADDRHLVAALAARGVTAEMIAWDDPTIDWRTYDLCIVRSTWDYDHPDRIADFRAWIDHVAARTTLWNPPSVLRWNMDKRYLRDLAARGIAVPETVWLSRGEPAGLATILDERGWAEAVVKPVVSASARATWRVTRDDPALSIIQARLERQLVHEAMMVQAFVPEVVTGGELSLIFIDGAHTHTVLKRAGPGDFRVQIEHGGSEERVAAEPALVAVGERVLAAAGWAVVDARDDDGCRVPDAASVGAAADASSSPAGALPSPPPYARVDLVPTDAGPLLLELELVEPSLFFGLCPEAAERLAETMVVAIGGFGS